MPNSVRVFAFRFSHVVIGRQRAMQETDTLSTVLGATSKGRPTPQPVGVGTKTFTVGLLTNE
ncbi:hypothetical protein ANO14919_137870 [Xylariales sp. No.14919]|nr:hypothetical protein ANO14919_137870 [Xylariales sp. No.14919]